MGNYFDDTTLPTGSLRCTCVYIAARWLDYHTQEAVLSQRAAKCGLHNSVKFSQCSPELDFRLADLWPLWFVKKHSEPLLEQLTKCPFAVGVTPVGAVRTAPLKSQVNRALTACMFVRVIVKMTTPCQTLLSLPLWPTGKAQTWPPPTHHPSRMRKGWNKAVNYQTQVS